jgi:hypothetical protein
MPAFRVFFVLPLLLALPFISWAATPTPTPCYLDNSLCPSCSGELCEDWESFAPSGFPVGWAFMDQSAGSGTASIAQDWVTGSNTLQFTSPAGVWVSAIYTGNFSSGGNSLTDTDFETLVHYGNRGHIFARANGLLSSAFCNNCYGFQVIPGAFQASVYKCAGGAITSYDPHFFPSPPCPFFKMRLKVSTLAGGNVLVEGFVDGSSTPISSFTDSSGVYLSGSIGMMSINASTAYDELRVNNIACAGATPTPSPTRSPLFSPTASPTASPVLSTPTPCYTDLSPCASCSGELCEDWEGFAPSGFPAGWAFMDQSGGAGTASIVQDSVTGSNTLQFTSPAGVWVSAIYTGNFSSGGNSLTDTDFEAVVHYGNRGHLFARANGLVASSYCDKCYSFEVIPGPNLALLYKLSGGSATTYDTQSIPGPVCSFFKMRLKVTTLAGGNVLVEGFVNGGSTPAASFTDSSGVYLSGSIGMMSTNLSTAYDDLKVNNIACHPSPTPTPTPTRTPSSSPSSSPTVSPSSSPTISPSSSPTVSSTESPTASASPSPAASPSGNPTPSLSATRTPTPSPPAFSSTQTPTASGAATPAGGSGALLCIPNPLNPGSGGAFVFSPAIQAALSIYDWSGRRVMELPAASISAAQGRASWDGRDSSGRDLASGLYFVLLHTPDGRSTAKFTILAR